MLSINFALDFQKAKNAIKNRQGGPFLKCGNNSWHLGDKLFEATSATRVMSNSSLSKSSQSTEEKEIETLYP